MAPVRQSTGRKTLDLIPVSVSVLFVGDYFSLLTTVALVEELREPNEKDEDFAVRLASTWMREYYGWDVEAVSRDIGVVDA